MRAETSKHRRHVRQRTHGAAELEALLIVDLDALIVLAVVETEMHVTVVLWEVVVKRQASIGRRHRRRQRNAFREHSSLESVAVDPFLEIDPRRLLDAKSQPRSSRHPIIEVELTVRI